MRPGTLLDNRFRIVRKLGQGGEGEIFIARDEYVQRDVAVKAQLPRFGESSATYAEFSGFLDSELNRLEFMHEVEGIPRVVANGWYRGWGRQRFIVMELVDGMTITKWTAENRPVHATEAACVIAQLCDILKKVHRHHVHRDVTPANTMIEPSGRVRLLDVGISVALGELPDEARGTPGYAPPEQYDRAAQLTPKVDVFALGAMLFAMTVSRLPYADVEGPASSATPAFPDGLDVFLPDELWTLGLAMVSVDPAERPTAEQVRHYLEPWLPAVGSGRPSKASDPDPSAYIRFPPSR
ncbi:hypothetical protein GCM10009759_69620 [Kitasatospora saccharophila]|uniref:non-specific serine/threonine protein kinase n=1 Tax=Kitasatospora saccharophila TaxID=407973 RepID=A0ABN2Y1P4_9ACTN